MTHYCQNAPCEFEAVYACEIEGATYALCLTCKEAFEWGQTRPHTLFMPVEDLPEEKATCPRCGAEGCSKDQMEDHGMCRSCHKRWQFGELDDD